MGNIKEKGWGIYVILGVLILSIRTIISFFFKFPKEIFNNLFGPLAIISFILILGAIASIFLKYKGRLIVISLPFIWELLNPLSPSEGLVKGNLISLFVFLFQGNWNFIISAFLEILTPLLCLAYLFFGLWKESKIKNIDKRFLIAVVAIWIIKRVVFSFF